MLEKVLELLRRQGRATYRALKLRYDLTDEYLETLNSGFTNSGCLFVR